MKINLIQKHCIDSKDAMLKMLENLDNTLTEAIMTTWLMTNIDQLTTAISTTYPNNSKGIYDKGPMSLGDRTQIYTMLMTYGAILKHNIMSLYCTKTRKDVSPMIQALTQLSEQLYFRFNGSAMLYRCCCGLIDELTGLTGRVVYMGDQSSGDKTFNKSLLRLLAKINKHQQTTVYAKEVGKLSAILPKSIKAKKDFLNKIVDYQNALLYIVDEHWKMRYHEVLPIHTLGIVNQIQIQLISILVDVKEYIDYTDDESLTSIRTLNAIIHARLRRSMISNTHTDYLVCGVLDKAIDAVSYNTAMTYPEIIDAIKQHIIVV